MSLPTPILNAQAIQRAYGSRVILEGVDLTLHAGERVGLLGDNGAGKSTLGRILAGLESSDRGEIKVRKNSTIAYLAQEPDLDGQRSARDVALSGVPAWVDAKRRHDEASTLLEHGSYDGNTRDRVLAAQATAAADLERCGGWDLSHRADAMLGYLGLSDAGRVVGAMSGGEQRRVAIARLLLAAPDLAILDEPTNHLDVEAIEWLERYLADTFAGAVLLITHDRYILDRVSKRTVELEGGRLYSYRGGYAAYLEGKADREAHAARADHNRRNFLRRELSWLRRSPSARGTKQRARVDRARQAMAASASLPAPNVLSLKMAEARSAKTILQMRGVCLQQGGDPLLRDLELSLTKGERMGIIGPNGSGKTTLLRAILGEHAAAAGTIVLGKNVQIAYLSQGRDGLDPNASVLDNVAGGRLVVRYGGRDMDARGYLQRFFFDGPTQQQPVGSLSGGERTRAALANLLCRDANLVILDEPTNDLDVRTLGALEEMLLGFGGSALIVSHDRYFLDRVATTMLVAEARGTWTRYAGNYSDYLAQRTRPEVTAARSVAESVRPSSRSKSKPKGGLTYGEQLELEALPAHIEAAEQRVADLEVQLTDPALYREQGDRVAGLQAEHAEARAAAEALYARWEHLEEKRPG